MAKILSFFLTFVLIFSRVESKEYLLLKSRDAGFFSIFMDVVGNLSLYDKGLIDGLRVDFGDSGLYYDSEYGENWWNYYFEPLSVGEMKTKPRPYLGLMSPASYNKLASEEMHFMILKYIQVKQDIEAIVKDFVNEQFSNNYVIGVHYRGTDKKTEVPRVPYQKIINSIKSRLEMAEKSGFKNIKIFIATDEQHFLNAMQEHFPDKICYQDAMRATNDESPLHTDPDRNPYQCGREVLIDCLLLSNCNDLIRTQSNITACVLFFNPYITHILVQ